MLEVTSPIPSVERSFGLHRAPFSVDDYGHYMDRHIAKRTLEAIKLAPRLFGAGDGPRVLADVGCGDGELLDLLLQEAVRIAPDRLDHLEQVNLVEPDARSLATAEQRIRARVDTDKVKVVPLRMKFEDLFFGFSADVIVMSHVLYYVADWASALRRVASFLTPDGRAVIILASSNGTIFRLRDQALRLDGVPAAHARPYFGEDLLPLLPHDNMWEVMQPIDSRVLFPWGENEASVARVLSFLYHCSRASCRAIYRSSGDTLWYSKNADAPDGIRSATYSDIVLLGCAGE